MRLIFNSKASNVTFFHGHQSIPEEYLDSKQVLTGNSSLSFNRDPISKKEVQQLILEKAQASNEHVIHAARETKTINIPKTITNQLLYQKLQDDIVVFNKIDLVTENKKIIINLIDVSRSMQQFWKASENKKIINSTLKPGLNLYHTEFINAYSDSLLLDFECDGGTSYHHVLDYFTDLHVEMEITHVTDSLISSRLVDRAVSKLLSLVNQHACYHLIHVSNNSRAFTEGLQNPHIKSTFIGDTTF
ncbi:hypothetical protein [Halalkalibacillus halophilus]|uniref:hypothetical protein n=1 Tax=Halalkalibacillus halophilus TaxID=392827 RepID=UPI00041BDEAF|nr:hypothetical protein [Halalkalibacillus halophilus]